MLHAHTVPRHVRETGFVPARIAVVSGVVWAALVIILAISGFFDVPPETAPWPTLLALGLPVAAFLIAVSLLPAVRRAILSLDPVLLTELQAWRVLGGVFLVALSFGLLPGLFAWPAGLGDIAVGIAAPFVALRLRQDHRFLTSRRYLAFLAFGLADFAVAVSTGLIARNAVDGLVEGVTSTAMGQFPLVLIPTLVVPVFIVLHLIVLFQIIAARRTERDA